MASQSLYRKWRSQTFSDLVGQDPIVRTLCHAVRDGRLAHAYLFCGPRGTGKTSVARLLAKAVNCANPHDGEPCNECLSCRQITEGRSPDVFEIDAASNNGVDNIRELRENVNFLSTGGRYKVYIIDECFSYGELITLADGSKLPIGKIVESEWQGEVLSYNPQTGEIEPKPIVRHMRKRPEIPTVRITFDNNRSVICTINHKFYTPQGQVCAGHLEVGQFVHTNRERISRHQRAVIIGAALGDGCIQLTGSSMRARLSITHGVAQKQYLEYKIQLLGDLVRTLPRYQRGEGTYSKTGTYRTATVSRPEIAEIHRELYDAQGRKCITSAYLDQIDELGLALWYLDDGSLITSKARYSRVDGSVATYPATRSTLSMYGFKNEEAELVRRWLRARWGIEGGVSFTARGPVVWLTLPGTARLHEVIAPHVPPVMQYKLLPAYRGGCIPLSDDGTQSGLAVTVVNSIEEVAAPDYVYNIEVADNHNYFVRDILVANCHMLSVTAFNALLKTLEEPPPHVIFVLATTEAHKVLPTIVSRCQRFDFRRFSRRVIVERLNHVAAGENLALEPAAADLLARAAQGGMRDAVSLLDQAMAFCGREITLAGVRGMLGLADAGAVRALVEHVAAGRAAEGLHLINELVVSGADLRQLNSQIGEYWRALVLARAGANVAEVIDCGPEEAAEYGELASRFALEELAACARVFAANETPARGLPVPQLGLELSFLECLGIRQRGGAAQPIAPTARPQPVSLPAASPRPTTPPTAVAPSVARPSSLPAMPRPEAVAAPPPAVSSAALAPADEAVEELDLAALDAEPALAGTALPEMAVAPGSVDAKMPTAESDDGVTEDTDGVAQGDWLLFVQDQWELVKKVCKQKKRTIAALLHSARPIMVASGDPLEIVLQADYQFHLDKLREPACRADVEWALEQVLERPCHIRLVLAGQEGANAAPGASGPRGNGGGGAIGPSGAGPHPGGTPGAPGGKGNSTGGNGHTPAAPPNTVNHNSHTGPAHNGHSANGSASARANLSKAHLTPLPRPADVAPSSHGEQNGHNGNGALHDMTTGYTSMPDVHELEAEALADPLVQEFIKELPARLVDVRPLDPSAK